MFAVIDASSGILSPTMMWLAIALLMLIVPALVAWVVSIWLYKTGKIKLGDMKIGA